MLCFEKVTFELFDFESKAPPITITQKVLNKFKSKNPHRTVRTDQGGELGLSQDFQKMVANENFTLEVTGADASAQNAIAESPNKHLVNMMRCLLHAADLGPEYWSFALRHAVYVKNRIPHKFIKITPYEALTGTKPNITNLRTFGCRVFVKKPGDKPAKLDHHTSNGIFVGYTATTKNIYYINDSSLNVKIGVHALFDEAHFTSPKASAPLAAQALQVLGYSTFRVEFNDGKFKSKHSLRVILNSDKAVKSTKRNDHSIGYGTIHAFLMILSSLLFHPSSPSPSSISSFNNLSSNISSFLDYLPPKP